MLKRVVSLAIYLSFSVTLVLSIVILIERRLTFSRMADFTDCFYLENDGMMKPCLSHQNWIYDFIPICILSLAFWFQKFYLEKGSSNSFLLIIFKLFLRKWFWSLFKNGKPVQTQGKVNLFKSRLIKKLLIFCILLDSSKCRQ